MTQPMDIPPDDRLRIEDRGCVRLLGMCAPQVNALGLRLREALQAVIAQSLSDPGVSAIVLHGCGKGFSAGGDIKEFGTPAALQGPGLSSHLQPLLESANKPVIAAIHGFALGGGLETAMACHYRVSTRDALIGLPEVSIGLIPLSGTQRLPRLTGLALAHQLITSAKLRSANDLKDTQLFDRLVDDSGVDAVLAAALQLADAAPPVRRTRDLPVWGAMPDPGKPAATPAQRAALLALHASARLDFDGGMAIARSAYEDCYRAHGIA